jgi:hypothetical protein
MKPEYLKLTDGREVRIMFNMNALGEFTSITGKEMTDLIDGKADVNMMRVIAWCAAREGEEADGRKFELDEKQFGRLIDMAGIVRFSQILVSQTAVAGQKKNEPLKKFPRIFFRKEG